MHSDSEILVSNLLSQLMRGCSDELPAEGRNLSRKALFTRVPSSMAGDSIIPSVYGTVS